MLYLINKDIKNVRLQNNYLTKKEKINKVGNIGKLITNNIRKLKPKLASRLVPEL